LAGLPEVVGDVTAGSAENACGPFGGESAAA